MRSPLSIVACLTVFLLGMGCVGNRVVVDQDAAADSLPAPGVDASVDQQPPPAKLDLGVADAFVIADGDTCYCDEGKVRLIGQCVPTNMLLTCGDGCDPNAPNTCGEKWVCDPNSATLNCFTSSVRPACIPDQAMSFDHNTLRISPTHGIAGQTVTLAIQGGKFYIGALWWVVTMGDLQVIVDPTSVQCRLDATFTPTTPGIYPILVGYGGNPTTLAGFYTASAGVTPPATAQPGYPCTPVVGANVCEQAGAYTCSCDNGRCNCTGP